MDSILLFPPGASSTASALQLGSWLRWDQNPDYGAKGLIESVETMNALRDGGVFAYRHAPIRHMNFPLALFNPASGPGAASAIRQFESVLRNYSTPGGYIAIQPEGVASSEAVYFDIIDGRWEPDYNPYHNRSGGYRQGHLLLDTQPWGYWPTEILLASAASIGFLGQLAIAGTSVVGDVPPLAHVTMSPTAASTYGVASIKWGTDVVAYGLGAQPSFKPFIAPAQFEVSPPPLVTGSLAGDALAPASQAWVLAGLGVGVGGPFLALDSATAIGSAIEPAYRGRYRAFGVAKMIVASVASAPIAMMLLDADRYNDAVYTTAATQNVNATVWSQMGVITGIPNSKLSPSPGYGTFDLGEITLPPQASGYRQGIRLRIWLGYGGGSVATALFAFGGVYLLPVDGAAGVLTAGLFPPDRSTGSQGAIEFNSNWVDSAVIRAAGGTGMFTDARINFRGITPRLGASMTSLCLLTADRPVGINANPTGMMAQANLEYAQVSVTYRPQFQFLHGL